MSPAVSVSASACQALPCLVAVRDGYCELPPVRMGVQQVHRIDVDSAVGEVSGHLRQLSRTIGQDRGDDLALIGRDAGGPEDPSGRLCVVDDEAHLTILTVTERRQGLDVDAGFSEQLSQLGEHARPIGEPNRELRHGVTLREGLLVAPGENGPSQSFAGPDGTSAGCGGVGLAGLAVAAFGLVESEHRTGVVEAGAVPVNVVECGVAPSALHGRHCGQAETRIHASLQSRSVADEGLGWRDRIRYRRTPELSTLVAHLALDHEAESADPGRPAFMAPPPGAPPYHGFRVLDGVIVDGFHWGAITSLGEPAPASLDGFVVAPDGSRAGAEWRKSSEPYVLMLAEPTAERWGVWRLGFVDDIVDESTARRALRAVIDPLRGHWSAWKGLST